jgi:hypothetical protein
VLLRGFGGLLSEPTQEHTTFAKEFSDRVRVIACLTRKPNMLHSDAASESLAGREWKDLRRRMRARHGDALILVWGDAQDTATACEEIVIRAREATEGVPSDTRQALQDGTTAFERVLPGPERMYPDTDLPPVAITEERLERIEQGLPTPVWERSERYRKLGVPGETIPALCAPRWARLCFGVAVWSDVEVESRRGSFRGLILPRSETADERTSCSSWSAATTSASPRTRSRTSPSTAAAKPTTRFPRRNSPATSQAQRRALRHRRHHRQPARLPHRRGHSRVLSGRALRLGARARRHLQPETEKLFGVFSENMGPPQYITLAERIGEEIARGLRRHRHRPRHGHHAPHRRRS